MSESVETVAIAGYIGVIYVLLFFFCCYVVYYYAEPGFPWHTYITLVIGYYASFGILLLVPIDIAACVVDRRSTAVGSYPQYDDNVNALSAAYDTFFTIVFLFGSAVLVFEEYYNRDGFFTVIGKLCHSFYRMCFDMTLGLIAGLIILGILIGQHVVGDNIDALKLTAIIITNTVYEIGLMFLLAYGLVEFPRMLWNRANLEYHLLKIQMKATSDYKNIADFKINIQEDISKVYYFKDMVGPNGDPKLLNALAILQSDCPQEFRSTRKAKADEVKAYVTKTGQITISGLARLRGDLNVNKDKYKMANENVKSTQRQAYFMEDLVEAKRSGNGVIHWSLRNVDSTPGEYRWHVITVPILYRIAAVGAALLSLFSFLGAISSMKGVSPSNSVYFLAVHSDDASPGGITIFILFTLGYAIYVSMWSMFQIRVSGVMELVPRSTSPENLSFNVRMCARLAAPLAFFYLGWLAESGLKDGYWTENAAPNLVQHINTTTTNTTFIGGVPVVVNTTTTSIVTTSQAISMPSSFSNFYQLQSVKAIKHSFGTIFPVILLVLVPLFLTNVFNRLLVLIKMDRYQFGTAIPTEEQLREGKRQLAKFKKIAERGEQRNVLKSHLNTASGRESQGLLGLFGMGSAAAATEKAASDVEAPDSRIIEPAELSGSLEKKGSSKLGVGANWKEVYGEVRSPGVLYFFKDKNTAMMYPIGGNQQLIDAAALAIVDLRLIINFNTPLKKGKDLVYLELELSDENIKLKFKSQAEQAKWKSGLVQWKDFAMDHADTSYIPAALNAPIGDDTEEIVSSLHNTPKSAKGASAAAAAATGGGDGAYLEGDDEDRKTTAVRPLMAQVKPTGSFAVGPTRSTSSDMETAVKGAAKPSKPAMPDNEDSDLKLDMEISAEDVGSGGDKPEPLEGWLDKKGSHHVHLSGGEWQKRYCRVDEASASLLYYKSTGPKEKPQGSIDLRTVNEIGSYDKSAKGGKADPTRISIDAGEKVYKFRGATAEEGQKWVEGLNAWKDYFLLNMAT